MILEFFTCGHGHYSGHDHDACQICLIGKPEARYKQDVGTDETTGLQSYHWTRFWPA